MLILGTINQLFLGIGVATLKIFVRFVEGHPLLEFGKAPNFLSIDDNLGEGFSSGKDLKELLSVEVLIQF